jgi:hypothetical protein
MMAALTVSNLGLSPINRQAQAVTAPAGVQEDARAEEGKQLKRRLVEIEGRLKNSDPKAKRQAEEDYRQIGLDYLAWAKRYNLPIKRETVPGPSRGSKAGRGGMMARTMCKNTLRSPDGDMVCTLDSVDKDSSGAIRCNYKCVISIVVSNDTRR